MAALALKLTDAGLAAVQAASGSEPTVLAELGITSTPFDYAPTLTALPGEFKRIQNLAGESAAPNIAHVTAYDTSADVWSATGFGLYLADGTLFAVHSSDNPILNKAGAAFVLISLDVIFESDLADNIAYGDAIFTSPPATTEMRGIVELATVEEAQAGLDQLRALTPEAAAVAIFSWLQWKNLQLGTVDVLTPNDGTTGGLRVRANPESGQAIIQFVTEDGQGQLGFFTITPGGDLQWSGQKLWNAGNDGAGSGLDADLLDGKDWFGGQDVGFGRVNAQTPNDGSTGGLRLHANPETGMAYLQVLNPDGSERGFIGFDANGYAMWSGAAGFDADLLDGHDWFGGQDVNFGIVNAHTPNVGSTGGIRLFRHPETGVAYLQILNADGSEAGFWRFSGNNVAEWVGSELQVSGQKVWHAGNDGAGSGADADLLDGQDGAFYTNIAARLGFTPMDSARYNDFLRDVGSNLSENGYLRLSNGPNSEGLMFCWGRFTAAPNSQTAVTFPMAFPTACFAVQAGGTSDSSVDSKDNWPAVRTPTITATGFSVFNANDLTDSCSYFAVGF